MSMHFSILVVEPEGINYRLLNVILDKNTYNLKFFSSCSEFFNYMHVNKAPDLLIINSTCSKEPLFKVTVDELLAFSEKMSDWDNVPKMLLLDKSNNPSPVNNADLIDCVINIPFNPVSFVKDIYSLLEIGIQRHIKELNSQHLKLSQLLQKMLKRIDQNSNNFVVSQDVNQLTELVSEHFKFEENYMSAHYYNEYEAHKSNHDIVLLYLQDLSGSLSSLSNDKIKSKLKKLQKDIYGDINDDSNYIQFLETARKNLFKGIKASEIKI